MVQLALERRIQEAIVNADPESVSGDFDDKKLQNFPGERVIYLALDHLDGGSMSTGSLQPFKENIQLQNKTILQFPFFCFFLPTWIQIRDQ